MRRSSIALLSAAALLVAAVPTTEAAAPWSGAQTVTLEAPQPDWYDDALHERVLSAAEQGEGVALPEDADLPASALAFTGIRPGSWMIFPAGCTLNFVFGSVPDDDGTTSTQTSRPAGTRSSSRPDNGNGGGPPDHAVGANGGGSADDGSTSSGSGGTYIGTAGHCTEVGEEVTIVAAPGVLMNIGTTVTSVDNGIGDDFALIEIREEMVQHVNPSTAYYGGPTDTGDPQFGDLAGHAGHGVGVGTGGTPRAGVVVYRGAGDESGSDAFAWDGLAAPGDSGSFVVDLDGITAAGNLTHLIVGGPYVPGVIAGTSIERMLEIAGEPLVTAPAGPDPTS